MVRLTDRPDMTLDAYRGRTATTTTTTTIDLMPNLSLVVGPSSVYISRALRARDISASRLTSNQRYIGKQMM